MAFLAVMVVVCAAIFFSCRNSRRQFSPAALVKAGADYDQDAYLEARRHVEVAYDEMDRIFNVPGQPSEDLPDIAIRLLQARGIPTGHTFLAHAHSLAIMQGTGLCPGMPEHKRLFMAAAPVVILKAGQ